MKFRFKESELYVVPNGCTKTNDSSAAFCCGGGGVTMNFSQYNKIDYSEAFATSLML